MNDSGKGCHSGGQAEAEGCKAYPYLSFRKGVWREIVRYVQRDIGPVECLVELGPGFCDFINQYPARRKICFELNPAMNEWAGDAVDMRLKSALALRELGEESADCLFASNFLEHLDEKDLGALMPQIRSVLKKGGRLVLIQPNYRLCGERYFEDVTHKTVFSDENIAGFLKESGFRVVKTVPGLLPFSMNSRLPKWPLLIRLYLSLPLKPRAAQMYVVAEKE